MTGTTGDQFVEGSRDWTGDGGAEGSLAAGSRDPGDGGDETLLTDCGLGEAACFVLLSSGVLEALLMDLVVSNGDCLLWGDTNVPLRRDGGLQSEELEAVVGEKPSAGCDVQRLCKCGLGRILC